MPARSPKLGLGLQRSQTGLIRVGQSVQFPTWSWGTYPETPTSVLALFDAVSKVVTPKKTWADLKKSHSDHF